MTTHKLSHDEVQQLVEASKQDPTQFAKLYDQYVDAIYRYVFRRVNKREVAEDVTSQTFFDALHNIHQYQYQGFPFSSWLYKIAHNNVLQYYRKTKGRETVDLEAISELRDRDPERDPREYTVQREREAHIEKYLSLLRDEDRELIRMKYLDDLSNIEMAEVLGITPNNVGVMLHRAMKKLEHLMQT